MCSCSHTQLFWGKNNLWVGWVVLAVGNFSVCTVGTLSVYNTIFTSAARLIKKNYSVK